MPKILNMRNFRSPLKSNQALIDRTTIFGNPFRIGPDGTREQVIAKHKKWLRDEEQKHLIHVIKRDLKNKDLVCWCAPAKCHGDLLLKIANEED